ncbi:acyltransferase family protein [Georgenia faecalis]|uniref:Acyltransferase family protein n=1 Tax=Georgenia faecalis TaxID=2483799 RepID=A0ABV9DD29_9MICO|nr:acyltransferase family protein [Georgenia faecalis]
MIITTEATPASPPHAPGAGPAPGFRPELEGLRALAVLMVVVYHVWLDRVSGGVDIFLMISAFLLTLSFVRRVESGRPLDLGRHWLHRFKRLLPAAAVTILGTLGATWLLLPASRWTEIIDQAWASLLYVQNWLLASRSVDYYAAEHATSSPLQHFWSLSIQGQVFLLWPLVLAGGAWLASRSGLRYRSVLWVAFGAVFAGSLAFSVHSTATHQAFAYFDSRARLWEFAVGSLLALALPHLRLARSLRVALGWLGLAAMLACGLLVPVDRAFPGAVALWPILAAALVMVAGQTGSRAGADRVLSCAPLVRVGRLSYALYLVHWPILVIVLAVSGEDRPGFLVGLAIIAVSLAAAWLVTHGVESPLRRARWTEARRWRMALVVVACLAVVAVPLAGAQGVLQARAEAQQQATAADHPGATALREGYTGAPEGPAIPLATELRSQWVSLGTPCAGDYAPRADVLVAGCGQTAPLADPERLVVVVGDSHAEQWMGALVPVAEQEGWQLVSVLEGGCAFGSPDDPAQPEHCREWLDAALAYVLDLAPDAVFTMATAAAPDSPDERLVHGYAAVAAALTDAGIEVIGVRDNPRFTFDMYACVEDAGAEQCAVPLDQALAPVNPAADLGLDGFHAIDLTDRLCPEGTCQPVIGNVHVYLDHNHLTADYAATMAPDLRERLLASTGWRR